MYERAVSKQKDLMVLEGASHFDLYDNPKYVDKAVERFAEFYKKNLK